MAATSIECEREGLFRNQDDRRQSGCSPYAPGAGSNPGPWRSGSFQRIHARTAVTIWHPGLAQRAGNAGRDYAAATVVSIPPVESIYWARTVLVPLLVLQALRPRAKNPLGV